MNNERTSERTEEENKKATASAEQNKRGPRFSGRKDSSGFHSRGGRQESEWEEKVVKIRRVTKVVKGGKNLSFSALVIVGDKKGSFGIGLGKAAEVVDAIRKASERAKKNLIKIPFDQGSIPHNVEGNFLASKIRMFKAPKGTGLIACWSVKMALQAAGLHNVVCKLIGSRNPNNSLRALRDAVLKLKTKNAIRQMRKL